MKARFLAWMSGLAGAWALRAWRAGSYDRALLRLRRSWFLSARRRPALEAFLLTAAGRSAEALDLVAAAAAVRHRPGPGHAASCCDPGCDLRFAAGRALLAGERVEEAVPLFGQLQQRYVGSAAARLGLGDALLWAGGDAREAQRLLEGALADPDRHSLTYWNRLGLEAELRASHAWAMGCLSRPAELLHSLELAVALAGRHGPVRGAVFLRLGFAFAVQGQLRRARSYWTKAARADRGGWAGRTAAAQLERTATRLARRAPTAAMLKSVDRP